MSRPPINCHWVTRWVTESWEVEPQRSLRYYDFPSKELKTWSSEWLFAKVGVNSGPVEQWLNRMVEKPLRDVKDALVARDLSALKKWPHYRAASLMIWLQSVRHQETLFGPADGGGLAALAGRSDADTDELVKSFGDYELAGLFPPDNHRLFFPSSGMFAIPVNDPGCLTKANWAFALALHPTMAIAAVPASAALDPESLTARLVGYSVGSSAYAEQVVIPPDMVRTRTDNEIISIVTSSRTYVDEVHALTAEIRFATRDLYEVLGVEMHVDGADRLRRGPVPSTPATSSLAVSRPGDHLEGEPDDRAGNRLDETTGGGESNASARRTVE